MSTILPGTIDGAAINEVAINDGPGASAELKPAKQTLLVRPEGRRLVIDAERRLTVVARERRAARRVVVPRDTRRVRPLVVKHGVQMP